MAATTVYLTIGIVGTILILLSLLFGSFLDFLDFGEMGGPFSLPVIAGFLGFFGYAGAITAGYVDDNAALIGGLGGVVVAIPGSWGVMHMMRKLSAETDKTLSSTDYTGNTGVVITPISPGQYGEISVSLGGQPLKLSARAEEDLPAGTPVVITHAPSETLVIVSRITTSPTEKEEDNG